MVSLCVFLLWCLHLLSTNKCLLTYLLIILIGSIRHDARTALHVARNLSSTCIHWIFLRLPQAGDWLLHSCCIAALFPPTFVKWSFCRLLECNLSVWMPFSPLPRQWHCANFFLLPAYFLHWLSWIDALLIRKTRWFCLIVLYTSNIPSVLWHCWLGGIWPIKNLIDEVLAWLSVWSEMQMPLPPLHVCFSKIQNGSSFWYPLIWVVPIKGL